MKHCDPQTASPSVFSLTISRTRSGCSLFLRWPVRRGRLRGRAKEEALTSDSSVLPRPKQLPPKNHIQTLPQNNSRVPELTRVTCTPRPPIDHLNSRSLLRAGTSSTPGSAAAGNRWDRKSSRFSDPKDTVRGVQVTHVNIVQQTLSNLLGIGAGSAVNGKSPPEADSEVVAAAQVSVEKRKTEDDAQSVTSSSSRRRHRDERRDKDDRRSRRHSDRSRSRDRDSRRDRKDSGRDRDRGRRSRSKDSNRRRHRSRSRSRDRDSRKRRS